MKLKSLLRSAVPESVRIPLRRWVWKAFLNARPERVAIASLIREHTHVSHLIARTESGDFMFDARDSIIGWSIAADGGWAREETIALTGIISEGDAIIDVGANLGWFTVHLARAAGENGHVYAFEPDPGNFLLLRENLARNGIAGRVTSYRLAVLDRPGSVRFELSPDNHGDHRVRFDDLEGIREIGPALEGEPQRATIMVDAVTLDEALSHHTSRFRLLKLDCQGAEPAIIKGAQNVLSKTDYLATEYWPYGIRRAGYDPRAFIDELADQFNSFATFDGSAPIQFKSTSLLGDHARTMIQANPFADFLLKK